MFDYEYDQVVEEYEQQIEQLENENAKMKSALNKFCAEFMCRECPFLYKENEQCTIAKLLL